MFNPQMRRIYNHNDFKSHNNIISAIVLKIASIHIWSHGVVVSTLDFESKVPNSNLGGTLLILLVEFSNQ